MRLSFSVAYLLLLCISHITASPLETPQEIRVQLTTKSSLSPIYTSYIVASDDTLQSSYLKELERILEYDFQYNGKTQVVAHSQEKERMLVSKDTAVAFNIPKWKASGIPYVVQLSVKNKKVTASICNVVTGSVKVFSDTVLSGRLQEDRRQVHKLADAIYCALFQENGISSSRILYSYQNKAFDDSSKNVAEIWECDWDGSNSSQVTHENTYCISPVLIPKGGAFHQDMFLYVSYKSGQPKIFISSFKGSIGQKAVDLRGNQLLPAISQNRDMMAFICDASGRADLFVQPIQPENGRMGTPVQLFSFPRSTQASPTFSSDGSKIAFASDKDGSTRIYIIPTRRGEKRAIPQLITKKNRENSCPSWSPDGTKLAYSAKTEGIRQIWIYDFISGEEYQLTSGSGNKENPCWAANNLHLVFNSTDSHMSDLYLVNLNQTDAIKITNGPGKKHYPSWGPR